VTSDRATAFIYQIRAPRSRYSDHERSDDMADLTQERERFGKILDGLEAALKAEVEAWPEPPSTEPYCVFETGVPIPPPDEVTDTTISRDRAAERSRELLAFVHETFEAARAIADDPDLLWKQRADHGDEICQAGGTAPSPFPLGISPAARARIEKATANVGLGSVSVEALEASGAIKVEVETPFTATDDEIRKYGVDPSTLPIKQRPDGTRIIVDKSFALDRGVVEQGKARSGDLSYSNVLPHANVQAFMVGRSFGPPAQAMKVTELQWPEGLLTEKAKAAIARKFANVIGEFVGYGGRGYTTTELKSMTPDEAWKNVIRWEPYAPVKDPAKIEEAMLAESRGEPNDGGVLRVVMPAMYLSTIVLPENREQAIGKLATAVNKFAEEDLLAGHMVVSLGALTLALPKGEAVFSFLMPAPTRRWRDDEKEGEHFLAPFRRFLGPGLDFLVVPEGDAGVRLLPDEKLECPMCHTPTHHSDFEGCNLLVPGALICKPCMRKVEDYVAAVSLTRAKSAS
jgi:hypothetical protein